MTLGDEYAWLAEQALVAFELLAARKGVSRIAVRRQGTVCARAVRTCVAAPGVVPSSGHPRLRQIVNATPEFGDATALIWLNNTLAAGGHSTRLTAEHVS